MSDKLFQVILLPHTQEADVPLENVQTNLAKAFQVDIAKIEALYEKTPTIIKSSVDKPTAELFRDAIIRSGADCEIREQTSEPLSRPPSFGKKTSFPAVSSDPDQDKILEIIREFQPQAGLHVHPRIPESKLKNALERCRVHPMETVLALVDCTVFGSAKNCLMITNGGVYYSNDAQGSIPGGSIPHYELVRRQLELKGEAEVSLGKDDALETSASPMAREQILALLEAVRGLFA